MDASRSSTSSLNAAAILPTWMPNVPRNSPSALSKVQLWKPQPIMHERLHGVSPACWPRRIEGA